MENYYGLLSGNKVNENNILRGRMIMVISYQEFERQYGYLLSWEDAEKKAGRKLDWNNNLDCGIYHDLLIEETRKNGIDVPTE